MRNKQNKTEEDENEDNENYEHKVESKNLSLSDLKLASNDNVILVLGSEAAGITYSLNDVSNYNVFIPPSLDVSKTGVKPYDLIDSLNVGVSAGILITSIKSQLTNKPINKH